MNFRTGCVKIIETLISRRITQLIKLLTPTKLTSAFLYIMPIYLLLIGPGGYTDISRFKVTVFYIVSAAYLLLLIVGAVTAKLRGTLPAVRIRAVHIAAAVYAGTVVLSALISPHFPVSLIGATRFEGALTLLIYTALFTAVSLFGRPRRSHFYVLAVALTLFSVLSFLQLAGLDPLSLYPTGTNYYDGGKRYIGGFIGTVGNIDFAGALLCLMIPFFAYKAFRGTVPERLIGGAVSVMLAVLLFLIGVEAAIIGLLASLIFALPIILRFNKRQVTVYLLILLLLGAVLLVLIRFLPSAGGTLGELKAILSGDIRDEYGSGRVGIWRKVLDAAWDSPIFGHGPDTMYYADFERFSTYYPALGKTLTSGIDTAHNEYLNILYSSGIVGLAAYTALLFLVFRSYLKKLRSDRSLLPYGICAAAYAVQAFFGISIYIVTPFFFIFLGLMCGEENEAADG